MWDYNLLAILASPSKPSVSRGLETDFRAIFREKPTVSRASSDFSARIADDAQTLDFFDISCRSRDGRDFLISAIAFLGSC